MSFDLPFELPVGWQVATVEELVKRKIIAKPLDGNHGGTHPKASDYVESGIPFVMASDLSGGQVDLISCKFITEKQASSLRKGFSKAGDILLSHKATIGRTAIVQDNDYDFIMLTPQVTYYRVIDTSLLSNIYLKAYFDSRFFQSILALWAGAGSTRAYLGITGQLKLPIILPPIEIQSEISGHVDVLNRKITLNNGTNQTLEEMAQAIFKSWFVDFDPVKAKMNGEQPEGMDAATASLFPEKLVESELGLIPEGWEVSTLSSLIKLTGGGTPKRSEETYWNGDIPWFSVRDAPSGSNVFVVDTDEKITELGLNKSSTKLLPKGTTIITARGTVGKLALVGTDMCMNQSCYGIRGKEVGDFYNYFNLNEAVSTLQRNTHGAVFDTITTKTFDTYSMAFSGAELANKFDALVAPLLQKIEANVRQNIELATLRDTLLPKLLSGEIELDTTINN
ncbi:restriction endonuclease subunit S [Photobacterium phosphoreum]|uniref:restriction endonuclease subunit S n=1 Tax=Photobacterium phosphoreum TaxID=659 RepID=UPI0007F93FCC|nr:restriction endonuclease subunit S [Photobacterium phosphoreum]OBU38320.1 hypothetical protein AYY25_04440 [Photobacterium phosphoreum]PSU79241.1 restriction endonuclease subunit S [Photobacterium phosphoreum]